MKIIQLAVVCLALACMTDAHAHAFLDRARPAVGSTVRASPPQLELRFSVPLDAASSTVKVLDKSGRQIDRKDRQVDRTDPTVLKVSLPPLSAGTYRVVWRVSSADRHVSEGDFNFEVAP